MICQICKEHCDLFIETKDYNRKVSNITFRYYYCNKCKLYFISQIPHNLHDYYTDKYYKIPDSVKELEILSTFEKYKLDMILRLVQKGRILEIGPSFGAFVYLAKKAGFEVEAVEMDARCCDFLEKKIGIRAINNLNISNALNELGHNYDVIALWHVIEHIVDPWIALKAIAAKIKPEGYLLLSAPNPRSLQFKILGKYWAHLDAPRHVSLIPTSLLETKLRPEGLIPIFSTTKDPGSIGWNHFGWQTSLVNFASGPITQASLSLLGKFISTAVSPLDQIEGFGSAYTVIFKKVGTP